MSDINVAFFYESLDTFLSRDYKTDKPLKSCQIIPYCHIIESGDVYAILTLSKGGCVKDFGTDWGRNKSFQSYVSDTIRETSLNTINLSEDWILKNSHIGYSTSYDVTTGRNVLTERGIPALFVRFDVPTFDDLNRILEKFRDNFSKVSKSVIESTTDVSNIIYMPVEDLFYVSRFTTYKVNEGDVIIEIDMESAGFPAYQEITEIYSPLLLDGDIPCSDKYNELSNCCPSVDFYTDRSILLRDSLLPLFNQDFPIMVV